MIFNMMCGGGGAGIDLTVVGGTTQPTSPEKNTIWVNTSTTIGNIYLQATEPTSPAEGDIWVMTGTKFAAGVTDVVQMNVCDEPSTIISLVAVKQYISGAWVLQTDSFYDGSAWHDSTSIMFSNGAFGGYTVSYYDKLYKKSSSYTIGRTSGAPVLDSNNSIRVNGQSVNKATYTDVVAFWDVDVSEYTALNIETTGSSMYQPTVAIMASTSDYFSYSNMTSSAVRSADMADLTNPFSLDISDLTGTYHILAYQAANTSGGGIGRLTLTRG